MKYPETGSTQGTRFVLNVPVRRARGRRISTDGALEPPPTRRSRCHRINLRRRSGARRDRSFAGH
jgi:hypothetical protein